MTRRPIWLPIVSVILALWASGCAEDGKGKGKIPRLPSFPSAPPFGSSLSAGAEALARSNSAIDGARQYSSKKLAQKTGPSEQQDAATEATSGLPEPSQTQKIKLSSLPKIPTTGLTEGSGGKGSSDPSGNTGFSVQSSNPETSVDLSTQQQDATYAGGSASATETVFSGAGAVSGGSLGKGTASAAMAALHGLFKTSASDTEGPGQVANQDLKFSSASGNTTDSTSSTLSLSGDPGDYFARIDASKSLFQIIERRYRQTSNTWAAAHAAETARSLRSPARAD